MVDYLYYKLYKAALKTSVKDVPVIAASAWFGGLMGANILVVYLFLVKINVLPYVFKNFKQGGWLFLLLIAISILYFGKDRRASILERYAQESDKERVRGNTLAAIYVAVSFLLIFAVAFFGQENYEPSRSIGLFGSIVPDVGGYYFE